jgi:A/G-specific adenine glycosylase
MTSGEAILNWYNANKRDLPWRQDRDPYRIWVSEIMLQQTQVDTVLGYYERFLQRFPDIPSLAAASESDVLAQWQGMGYYGRARNLHKGAKQVVEKRGGRFPDSLEAVRALPGIGEYTAGAIMSIAYDMPCPAVDGNVNRVIARLDGIGEDTAAPRAKKQITARVAGMMPKGHAGDFTQAMMELGALVCTPKSPDCGACPASGDCFAFKQGKTEEYPISKKKEPPTPERYRALTAISQGAVLMEHRKHETLLGGMWGLPLIAAGSTETDASEKLGFEPGKGRSAGNVRHVFSHRIWEMDVQLFEISGIAAAGADMAWVKYEDLRSLPIPAAFRKALKKAGL